MKDNFLISFRKWCGIVLRFIIGTEDANQTKLESITPDVWVMLAHPYHLRDGTFVIFPYNNVLIKDAMSYIKNTNSHKLKDLVLNVVSDILLEELSDKHMFDNFAHPLCVSLPETKYRKNKGFNPSKECARWIAHKLTLEFNDKTLIKTKETEPQKSLSRAKRLTNVRNTMKVKNETSVKGRNVILIDDITTTGATLTEGKRALLSAGALRVWCVAIAH